MGFRGQLQNDQGRTGPGDTRATVVTLGFDQNRNNQLGKCLQDRSAAHRDSVFLTLDMIQPPSSPDSDLQFLLAWNAGSSNYE